MSFLGRLFGRSAPPPPPAPPPNTVTIADDLAADLTAGGQPLSEAVEAALREQIAARARGAESRVPFWLTREQGDVDQSAGVSPRVGGGAVGLGPAADAGGLAPLDIEAELRDKLEKRRAAEGGATADG